MRNKYYYSLLILLLTLCCCKKSNNAPSTFTESSYPLAVGDWWQYQVINNYNAGSTDTLLLSAISMVTNGSTKDYRCNILKNGLVIDSGHFVSSDTVLYYNGLNPYYSVLGFYKIKLPFTAGQKWPGTFPTDTIITSSSVISTQISGVTYNSVYILGSSFSIPEYSLIQVMDVASGVGLIYESIDLQSDTAVWVQENIQLINYHLQ